MVVKEVIMVATAEEVEEEEVVMAVMVVVGPSTTINNNRCSSSSIQQPNESSGQQGRPSPWNSPAPTRAASPAVSPAPINSPTPDTLVPRMQSLEISKQALSSPSLDEADKKLPVRRPDNGGTKSIRTTRLRANHFNLSYNPESIIRHYDVDVKPEKPAKNGRPVKMSKSELSAIRKKLSYDNPSDFPLSSTAYDDGKNIFSAVPLPTGSFKVEVSEEEGTRFSSYIFTINLVNELKLCKLKEYCSGQLC